MYPAYPSGTQMPEAQRPPVPPQVKNAVKAMYAGAVVTVVGVVIEILTVGATKSAIEKRSPHLTASQVNASGHALVIGFAASWAFGRSAVRAQEAAPLAPAPAGV